LKILIWVLAIIVLSGIFTATGGIGSLGAIPTAIIFLIVTSIAGWLSSLYDKRSTSNETDNSNTESVEEKTNGISLVKKVSENELQEPKTCLKCGKIQKSIRSTCWFCGTEYVKDVDVIDQSDATEE